MDVWVEAALNGAAGRAYQPRIPIAVQEIIDDAVVCAGEGASLIHVHAYDADGKPTEDADIYSRIIEGVRARCDAIVYPTLALAGTVEERYSPIRALMRRGLLEVGVVDPGSVNITHRIQVAMGAAGFVYPNPDEHIREGLRLAAQGGWRPAFAIYEPGFARLGAALAATVADLKTPVYRIMFSDHLLFGMPPSKRGVEFYAAHLDETAPGAPKMLSGLDADVTGVMDAALERGFHIRVGLEDAPFGTDRSNAELVREAAQRIVSAGSKLASPATVRGAP
ncbi:MAG: 3-keto-5-aminohexanoate cleavage protein [Parvularculaceae bacterium]|nr:3-keto-5-aminohexanoate cleavage protein [Parvularculaceae bacterium]